MYFTNINNDELKHFKDTLIPFNFSMSLTSILNSSLFYIEDMGNSIYRIYPLFYCNEIISSNTDDKFFDTRCIIAIKGDNETYYTFKKDDTSVIYDYNIEHYFPEFVLGEDSLSLDDFNRLVYLIRKNRRHYEDIQIKHNILITSDYGCYLFDLQDSTITDEGIIITPETIENNCTVTLTNPVFHNSKYYLNLTIMSINNINLCPDDDYSIETSTIRIPLVRNAPVTIPFSEMGLYKIVSFDANVEIIHSEPIFIEESYVQLTASSNTILINESVTLNAVYYNSDGISAGKIITFKDNGVTIGTATTNNNGLATITYTPVSLGTCNIIADYDNTLISNAINIIVSKPTPSLSIISSTIIAFSAMPITISGALVYNGNALKNATIKLYDGDSLIDTVITDSTGAYTSNITATSSNMNLKAVFEGNNDYASTISSTVLIKNCSTYIELGFNGTTITPDYYATVPLDNNTWEDIVIDYGDGTIELSHKYGHTYSNSGDHTIKIYNANILGRYAFYGVLGLTKAILPNDMIQINEYSFTGTGVSQVTYPDSVTTIPNNCFRSCSNLTRFTIPDTVTTIGEAAFGFSGLTQINIPESVSSIGSICFVNCLSLSEIQLNWESASDIVSYSSSWIQQCSSFDHFLIPEGTTSLYIAKGYPSVLLQEVQSFDGIDLTSTKDILSYVDSDSCIVSAQLTDSGSAVSVSGQTVSFEIRKVSDDSLVETLQSQTTDASGACSVVYYAKGEGDIYIKASCMSLTKTYSIEDCTFYDIGTVDKTSDYTITKGTASLTHRTDDYSLTSQNSAWTFASPTNITLSTNTDWSIEISHLHNTFEGLCILDTSNNNAIISFIGYNNSIGSYNYLNNSGWIIQDNSKSITYNQYYHFILSLRNGVLYYELYDNSGNLHWSNSANLPSSWANKTIYPCAFAYERGTTYFKKFKIKPL